MLEIFTTNDQIDAKVKPLIIYAIILLSILYCPLRAIRKIAPTIVRCNLKIMAVTFTNVIYKSTYYIIEIILSDRPFR